MEDRYLYKAKTKCIVGTYNFGKEDGEWVKGYLYCDTGKWVVKQFETDRADYIDYEVDPSTICQCTGLKDKNGELIWENDIALRNSSQGLFNGKIVYDKNGCLCHREFKTNFEALLIGSERYIEVVGNIFNNPELSEVGE